MNYTKENAVERFCEIIVNSWTWARLTPREADAWLELIASVNIKGNAKQRASQTSDLYRAFLAGCGYSGPNWREPDPEDIPSF